MSKRLTRREAAETKADDSPSAPLSGGDSPRRRRRKRITQMLQVLSFVLVAVLGSLIFASKVGAQAGKGGAPAAPAGGGGAAKPAASAAPAAAKDAKDAKDPKAAAAKDAKDPKAAKDASAEASADDAGPSDAGPGFGPDGSQVDYATVQTDDDFPKDMSAEEKASIGTGKVPIHREGPFRSPFAHPRFGGPTKVKVGFVIGSIREFNIQTGGFEAEFFVSLTGDKDLPQINVYFPNGHDVNETVMADTPTFKLSRFSGKFVSTMDLRNYPFDTQELQIVMEDKMAGVDQLIFEPDKPRTSLDSEFRMPSFSVGYVGAKSYKHSYPTRFDRDDLYISRYKFILGIDRFATSAAFSVYVPAFIIVLISLIGMWVPPDELEVRSNAGAPMLAAAVLFHYSLIQALPATGYLTRADKLMLGVYISLLINMASTWALLIVDEHNVDKAFRWARAAVPPLTVVVMVLVCIW
ncbi:MAG: hypothetical protein JNL38_40705 [Myxococcales bacterium]|nr:hypothetical protein [Myxococcales bacterium]